MTDFDAAHQPDPELVSEFEAFVNAETLVAPPVELTQEQIIARLVEIEDKVRAIGRTMRRQEIEIQHTRILVESVPSLISGLRKELATDIATRMLSKEGHGL